MLETIYEVDENLGSDEDTSKSTNQESQLSVYMCWCMITGCFFILTFIIMISLNPHYLLQNSINENTQNLRNISFYPEDKLDLSTEITNYLSIFSHEINKQLDLQLTPILFLTSTNSNLTLENLNQNEILWIYGHLKYPQSCIDNIQCKENFHGKLKISFTELSNFINTIGLNSHRNRPIQFDWCDLIDNSTSATFISLVSIKINDQNVTETTTSSDHLVCEGQNRNIFLSNTIEDLISQKDLIMINAHSAISDDPQITSTTDSGNNIIENAKITCNNSEQRAEYTDNQHPHTETTHCPNDTGTQYSLMWNAF